MSDDDDARVPGDAYLQLGAELQSCTEEIKAIEAQQASLEAQKVVLKTRLRGIESQLGLPSSMPDTPNNGLLEAITKCLAPKPAVASKINGADGTTLSAPATPATPGVVLAGEVEPPPVKLDRATCFLTLVERNGGALVAHWSEIAVVGASRAALDAHLLRSRQPPSPLIAQVRWLLSCPTSPLHASSWPPKAMSSSATSAGRT